MEAVSLWFYTERLLNRSRTLSYFRLYTKITSEAEWKFCYIAYSKVCFFTYFWGATACWFTVPNAARLSLAKSPGDSQYQYPKIKEESKEFLEVRIRNRYCESRGLQLKKFLNLSNSQSTELSAVTAAEAVNTLCKYNILNTCIQNQAKYMWFVIFTL